MRRVQTFHPIESEGEKIVPELTTRSSKRDAEVELDHEGSKKQKTNKASGSVQELPKEEKTKLTQEDLQQMMMVVPVEEVYVEALHVKYQIIDWQFYSEDTRRDDLVKLWDLVKERFSTTESIDDKEKELWVKLKRLFKPNNDDTLWKLQRYMHDPLVWTLYDTCGVHHVSSVRGRDIFMLPVNDDPIPVDLHLSKSEDTGVAHLPKIKTRPDWLKPLPKEETPDTPEPDCVIPPNDLPETKNNWANVMAKMYKDLEENKLLWKTRDMASFIQWYCKHIGKKKLAKADFKDQIDLINPEGNRVVHDMSKPLPLGGPLGQITIQAQYFFNKDLEYLVFGNKERRYGLSITMLKAPYYPDFGLEELVLSLWTESESDYDISSAYGILHWWFKHKEFYITRHSAPSDRNAVRSHMKILSVVNLKTFFRYGYTFLKEIVLRRADYKEHILERD
ncbi:hypothetical protein Tco_1313889 [Tanacetum coccineum]